MSPESSVARGFDGGEVCVTPSGTCKFGILNKKDRHQIKDFEKMLKEESIMEEDESLAYIMEEASFNDTIGEIEEVVDLSNPHTRHVISINSIDMYTIIDNYK
jgi:hypothetical protein